MEGGGGGKTRGVTFDATNEMQSPRFRAIMRATSTRKRRPRVDVKSFSHELGLKGSQHYQIRNQRSEDTVAIMKIKFERLKEDVNSELGIFAADLVGLLEKTADDHPSGWKEAIEDLLVVARECTKMSPDEFWLKCEGIVQVLDDRRQELPMGTLKKAHTRMLFILTRCTRLLQFQKEGGLPEADHILGLHQLSDLGVYPSHGGALSVISHNVKNLISTKNMLMKERRSVDGSPHSISPSSRNRISSWKKLPSAAEMKINLKNIKDHVADALDPCPPKGPCPSPAPLPAGEGKEKAAPGLPAAPPKKREDPSSASPPVVQEQYQQSQLDGNLAMICRICDLKIPRVHVEDHSRICAIAARCDAKGLNVNERLDRVADVLERMLETCSPKSAAGNSAPAAVAEVAVRALYSSAMPERERAGDLSHAKEIHPRPSDDTGAAGDHSPPGITLGRPCTVSGVNVVPTILCKPPPPAAAASSSGPASATSSPGSHTPSSSSSTPRHPDMDLLFTGRSKFSDLENFQQIHDLLDIARCVANTNKNGYDSLEYLHASLEDLQEVIQAKKVDALLVETFGRRIEKLLREKYAYILQQIDDGDTYLASAAMEDEDGSSSAEIQASQSQCPRPMCSKIKDRTTIEDFEIIKPISRGAFGRVFLARKRVTGDLFAIKVLKKADMIRKNAVESILAERNILISVRNPFVVRFFYSFTCRENLYLVMEYLNGGDLYSLLRNLGCLDEDMTRMYIAEVILALEYLHSLNVVHRDLKPDNLLIAHDGHIKLTDFGLSKVGLINSTDDLSGPDLSSSTLLGDPDQEAPPAERTLKREQRQKQSVVGTPDYLAPEILLGMAHGPSADWWSVGIILYELLVGIPPFNAEHPQKIFDNIMNRSIAWPSVPAEMTYEAHDLIDKLLTENPVQRLGATGAGEVKSHPFFGSVNWDMLAKQKAAFVPSLEGDDDTSYFTCRHTWSSLSGQVRASPNDYDDTSDTCTMSCSSSPYSYDPDEEGDECGSLANFTSSNLNVQYSFSNFSFKNLSQLASMNYDLLMKEDYTPANISTTTKS